MADADLIELPAVRRASGRSPLRAQNDLQAAIVFGQVAGLAMMGVLALAFLVFRGANLAFPLQAAASVFLGDRALGEPTASALFLGAITSQLGPALFWSLVYGLLALRLEVRQDRARSVLLGCLVGAAAMVFDVYLLIPLVGSALTSNNCWTQSIPRLWDWLAHLLYGSALGFLYVDQRHQLGRGAVAQRPM